MKRNGVHAVPSLVTAEGWAAQLAEIERLKTEIAEQAFARLVEIEQERDRILSTFPHLRKRARGTHASNGQGRASQTEILYDASTATPEPKQRAVFPRRRYTNEERLDAIKRLKAGEYVSDVAKALDIRDSQIRAWAKKAGIKPVVMPTELAMKRWHAARKATEAARTGDVDPRRQQARDLRAAGKGILEIAKALGVSRSKAGRWISGANGSWIPAGKRADGEKREQRKYTAEEKAAAVERVRNGDMVVTVANDMGIATATIDYWLKKAKVKPHKVPPPEGIEAALAARAERIDATMVAPTLAFIVKEEKTDSARIAKKFGVTYSGAGYRVRSLISRGLAERIGAGMIAATEAGRSWLAERQQ